MDLFKTVIEITKVDFNCVLEQVRVILKDVESSKIDDADCSKLDGILYVLSRLESTKIDAILGSSICHLCMSLIKKFKDSPEHATKLTSILLLTLPHASKESYRDTIHHFIKSAKLYLVDNSADLEVSLRSSIKVMTSVVFNTHYDLDCDLRELIFELILQSDKSVAGVTLGYCLQNIEPCDKTKFCLELLDLFYSGCKRFTLEENNETERGLFVLCSILPVVCDQVNLLCKAFENDIVWDIIQRGFIHSDTVCRKSSLFILKTIITVLEQNGGVYSQRYICWSSSEKTTLSSAWSKFFLLIETMEEKQVRILIYAHQFLP